MTLRPVGQVVKTPPFHGGNRGSSPLRVTIYETLAQLVEHLTFNQGVEGSNPSCLTKFIRSRVRAAAILVTCGRGGTADTPS
jgi:hypothetical protein